MSPAVQPTTTSATQREAIRSPDGPVLVLAGPGAGKTYCLIERIRFLLAERSVDPARVCALAFTNKAAEEIAARLRRDLGDRAGLVNAGTLHSRCVEILRAHGQRLGLESGFGIADEEYQGEILAKYRVPAKWRGRILNRFGLHRLGAVALRADEARLFQRYRDHLGKRAMLDFDDLIHRTHELFTALPEIAQLVASRWDHLLVDEFQDLNSIQYAIVRTLTRNHRNLFAVGDDEQSIFSWTGADPRLLLTMMNDFRVTRPIMLDENWRTAASIFALARRLVASNPRPLETKAVRAERESPYPVEAISFGDESLELGWVVADLIRDQREARLPWGEYAVLYRTHRIGDLIETALMQADVPCRLAHGKSVSDDPAVKYLLHALRVIAHPRDVTAKEMFARGVLPRALSDEVRRQAEHERIGFMPMLRRRSRELAYTDENGRKIRRALYAMQNLAALAGRHDDIAGLIEEILSQRVGPYRTVLEQRSDELSDPASRPEVVRLAAQLTGVRDAHGRILVRPMAGQEIGLVGLLSSAGLRLTDYLGSGPAAGPEDFILDGAVSGPLGLALTTFKALQLVTTQSRDSFRDFVVVDLETTDRDIATAEIVEIAAARVRNWEVVEEFHRLVKPRVPISAQAEAVHRITMERLADAAFFEEVWPQFRAFIGTDILVAHNGYEFDFPILSRMTGRAELVTYDTLPLARWLKLGSAKLTHLAVKFGIDPVDPHRALSDVRTLAAVFPKLEEEKFARARRVALSGSLDHLGVALALADPEALDDEGKLLKEIAAAHSLGRFSNCLEFYREERKRVGPSAASVEELIERLGGVDRMHRVRADKRPDQRYPQAMARIGRLVEGLHTTGLRAQIDEFLGRVALSRSEGIEADPRRVNLLTLHSTKGLEFSRVYILGVEDSEIPGTPSGRGSPQEDLEEARRLLYVGMTRAKDRLVLTRAEARHGRLTGGHRFLDEMGLIPSTTLMPA